MLNMLYDAEAELPRMCEGSFFLLPPRRILNASIAISVACGFASIGFTLVSRGRRFVTRTHGQVRCTCFRAITKWVLGMALEIKSHR